MSYILRPYQEEAKEAVLSEWKQGNRKTLLVLPTGTGKTIVFSAITDTQVRNLGHHVLIVAHREELLSQAADKLYKATGLESSLEKAEHHAFGSDNFVTIGSVQTLSSQSRLREYPQDYFQDIIVDEAHHCLSASYQNMLTYFSEANVLGVTATPDRGDMRNLAEFFDSMAYEYLMRDAVRQGYLCQIIAQMIPLKLDLTNVRTSMGDYRDDDLGSALDPYLEQIADEMKTSCVGRKTLVFLPLIATSQKFCGILNSKGMKAAEVNGKSEDRAEILRDFEAGRYDILCNSMLLTEGWDCPSLDCIVVLRPTKIRSLYVQMVGRGTRICPGKENLLLLDFLWLTTKHNICRPSALIGKNDEEIRRIDEQIEEGTEVNLLEAEEKADDDIAAEARQSSLAKALDANKNKKRRTVDPLHLAPYVAPNLTDYVPTFRWEEAEPSQKQLDALEKFGIDSSCVTSKGFASELMKVMIDRSGKNLATPAQITTLVRFGYEDAEKLTKEQASKLIGGIAQNGWRRPGRRSA